MSLKWIVWRHGIYCGVAAFEREHALGCEKKECGVPVADSNGISYTFSDGGMPGGSMQVEQPARFRCSALHFCPTSGDGRGRRNTLCFSPHVAVHTNVLSHSSAVQGRDTIPGTPYVSPPAVWDPRALFMNADCQGWLIPKEK
ncbi:Uncharacterized protein DBV15_07383 [Temnothorax longispinosus]|uniref:Uncharacterized protein n=1 Tax=Temnothorax longispinosus TaxID=300112 RepID=A0A4S2KYY0_9HYME|nr:Uncharacterized protein DBV15_07383 [Temnothorax longispinosus]